MVGSRFILPGFSGNYWDPQEGSIGEHNGSAQLMLKDTNHLPYPGPLTLAEGE